MKPPGPLTPVVLTRPPTPLMDLVAIECAVFTVPFSTLPGALMSIDPTATMMLFRSHSSASGKACAKNEARKNTHTKYII